MSLCIDLYTVNVIISTFNITFKVRNDSFVLQQYSPRTFSHLEEIT